MKLNLSRLKQDQIKNQIPQKEQKNSGSTNNNTPLIERIPSDAGAVILIRVNDLLEKGRGRYRGSFTSRLTSHGCQGTRKPSLFGTWMFLNLFKSILFLHERSKLSPNWWNRR
jgi:hypothetical protein